MVQHFILDKNSMQSIVGFERGILALQVLYATLQPYGRTCVGVDRHCFIVFFNLNFKVQRSVSFNIQIT